MTIEHRYQTVDNKTSTVDRQQQNIDSVPSTIEHRQQTVNNRTSTVDRQQSIDSRPPTRSTRYAHTAHTLTHSLLIQPLTHSTSLPPTHFTLMGHSSQTHTHTHTYTNVRARYLVHVVFSVILLCFSRWTIVCSRASLVCLFVCFGVSPTYPKPKP